MYYNYYYMNYKIIYISGLYKNIYYKLDYKLLYIKYIYIIEYY